MNCIVCAIAKQENLYVYEWAKHHLSIGFSHIHIYDNNDIVGEAIADVFRGTDIEDQITIHDVRGKTCMQLVVYQQCYDNEDFDWCAFIDIDEFITFVDPSMCIQDFLFNKTLFDAVHLNWLCYGDDEQIASDGRPVRERIKQPIKPLNFKSQYVLIPDNAHVKSILQKGRNLIWDTHSQVLPWSNPHTPGNVKLVCNELGDSIINSPWNVLNHQVCYIAHYITKTISEYSVKMQRRSADHNRYYHDFIRFFAYNKLTIRKVMWIKRSHPQTKIYSILIDLLKWKLLYRKTLLSRFLKKYRRKVTDELQILEKINNRIIK